MHRALIHENDARSVYVCTRVHKVWNAWPRPIDSLVKEHMEVEKDTEGMEKSKKAEPSSAGLLLTLAPPPFHVCCFRAFLRRIVASKYVIDETDAVKSNERSPEETPATALPCVGPSKPNFNRPYCSRALVIYIRERCFFLFFISLSFLMIEFVRWRKNANYDISRGLWPLGRELLSILGLSLCDASRSNFFLTEQEIDLERQTRVFIIFEFNNTLWGNVYEALNKVEIVWHSVAIRSFNDFRVTRVVKVIKIDQKQGIRGKLCSEIRSNYFVNLITV